MAQRSARIVRDEDVVDGEPRHDLDVADVYAALTPTTSILTRWDRSGITGASANGRRETGGRTIGELTDEQGTADRDDEASA